MNLNLLTIVAFLRFNVVGAQRTLTVQTNSGPVEGHLVSAAPGKDVYEFLAIPYAEPPIGLNRFKKPLPKQSWTQKISNYQWPKSCPQTAQFARAQTSYGAIILNLRNEAGQSEDCLYLNIWIPRGALFNGQSSNLAAFTFIHGGGFFQGSTSVPFYNGTVLAGFNNIIVATIQYRLGALGFAYQGTQEMPGNMGLWDQLLALKWICANLPSFGGDCSKHAISGESAGAASVTYHLLSPHSRPYFTRAVVQSGSALGSWSYKTSAIALENTNQLAGKLSCQSSSNLVTCLRNVDAQRFPPIQGTGSNFGPIIDGDFVPDDPKQLLSQGRYYRAPLLIGANKDEGTLFILDNPLAVSLPQYVTEAAARRLGNMMISCPTYGWADIALRVESNQPPVYAYHFSQRRSVMQWPEWMGVTHADELPFTLGYIVSPKAQSLFGNILSNDDKVLSRVMMAYLANFAKFRDPNGRSNDTTTDQVALKRWPLYNASECPRKQAIQELEANYQLRNSSVGGNGFRCSPKAFDCFYWNSINNAN